MVIVRLLIVLAILIGILLYPTAAQAIVPQALPGIDNLNLSELNKFITTMDQDVQKYLPQLDPKTWGVTGPDWNLAKLGKGILSYFLRELIFNLRLLGELLLVVMALAILQNLRDAFEGDTVNQLAFSLCFLVVMGLVLNSFKVTFGIAKETLAEMNSFMYAIIPVVFTLIAAGGGVVTTSIVHPLLISSVGLMSGLVNNIVFPLLIFAGVLGMVNYLAEGFQINKLAQLLKTIALGLMGLAMVIFVGVITLKGFAGTVADSTALRTAKYFSNSFLPVVGGTLSDTMEMAASCSLVLRSGLGIYGLGLIILITIFPLAKILAVAAIYHLTGVCSQPLGNNRLADALQTAGGTFITLFAAVAIVGLMFFIAMAVLIGLSSYRGG